MKIKTKFDYGKPVVVGIATFPGREEFVQQVIEKLEKQADKIILYDNGDQPIDICDNGKFYGLNCLYEDVYYFTCDDDLDYPDTYVADMIDAIKRTGTIVTHHGRILTEDAKSYYFGHLTYRCLGKVYQERPIDVAGTGVTAWDTSYFNPLGLLYSKDLKMADLIFSLEAAKQKKIITILTHDVGYIKQLPVDLNRSICWTEQRKCQRQTELADLILKLNNENDTTS